MKLLTVNAINALQAELQFFCGDREINTGYQIMTDEWGVKQ